MSDRYAFRDLKLQYLLGLILDPEVKDSSVRVALYLALVHADNETGESYPSFETIAAALGRCSKSVKRALNNLEETNHMTIERGTNKGKSSRYRPTTSAMKAAQGRRRPTPNIVPFDRSKRGQKCPTDRTDLSSKAGQKCPPNLEQKLNGTADPKMRARIDPRKNPAKVEFVSRSICFARDWDERLERLGMERLAQLLPEERHGPHIGYWLPGLTPAPVGSDRWAEQLNLLNELIEGAAKKGATA